MTTTPTELPRCCWPAAGTRSKTGYSQSPDNEFSPDHDEDRFPSYRYRKDPRHRTWRLQSSKPPQGGALAGHRSVSAASFTRTTHEQWGWCAPSRGLMARLVKHFDNTGYRQSEGTTSRCAPYAAPECQLISFKQIPSCTSNYRNGSRNLGQQMPRSDPPF
jgi:hypothetical protein